MIFQSNLRNRVQWFNTAELERQRAHSSLRTPELAVYAQMAIGEQIREESTVSVSSRDLSIKILIFFLSESKTSFSYLLLPGLILFNAREIFYL